MPCFVLSHADLLTSSENVFISETAFNKHHKYCAKIYSFPCVVGFEEQSEGGKIEIHHRGQLAYHNQRHKNRQHDFVSCARIQLEAKISRGDME